MSEKKVDCYEFNDFRLDTANGQLFREGLPVSLTRKSYEILTFFVQNRGRILKKEELLDSLWEGNYVEEANLTQHIYMLRKALKQNGGAEKYIETIPKNGYRFAADVHEVADLSRVEVGINGGSGAKRGSEGDGNGSSNFSVTGESLKSENDILQTYSPKLTQTQSRKSGLTYIAATVLVLTATAFGFFYFAGARSVFTTDDIRNKSVAVLPFRQIDDKPDAKLGVGVADVLIARLANINEIDVRPTTSILRFANLENSDLFSVGKKLGVDCVIEGTIQRDKNIVRVTAQLYDVKERRQVWTEKFDEKYSDIFTLQDKISERLSQKISGELAKDAEVFSYKKYTKSPEAYRAYSMGLSFWSMHTESGFHNALKQFEKAVEIDPEFAPAYAYMADTYGHTHHVAELFSSDEARDRGIAAAKKALEIDPRSAEAMSALALIYASRDRQKEAFELMEKSLSIKPNDAHSRHRISWMYANKGQIDRAVEEMKIAQRLDPQSTYINLFLSEMLLLSRKPTEAKVFIEKALEIEPSSVSAKMRLIEVYEELGRFDEAEREVDAVLSKLGRRTGLLLIKSRILAKRGNLEVAQELFDEVSERGDVDKAPLNAALAEIALGLESKAAERMTKVVNHIEDNIYFLKYEPKLDPIRDNPIFAKSLEEKERQQGW